MGYNLEKLRFVFEILAFRSKMRKHFVLRIIRMAGVGGVNVVKTIPVSWTFTLAGEQYTETNIPVVTSSEQNEEYDCRIGLPTLMAHRKFIINFKNMWMRFED